MSIIYTTEPAEVDPVLGRALNKLRHQPCTSSTQKGLRLQRLLAKAPGMTLMLPGPRRILFYHLPQILVILPNAWCDMLLRFFQSFHRIRCACEAMTAPTSQAFEGLLQP